MTGGREKTSIVVALVVHLAVFASFLLLPAVHGRGDSPAMPNAEPSIEVSLDEPSSPPTPAAETAATDDAPARIATKEGSARAPAIERAPSEPASAAAPNSTGKRSEPAAPSGGSVTLGGPRVAIDGPNPFLAPGALPDVPGDARATREPTEAEKTADAKRRVEAALRQPARERERELGLGPEGPVITALGDATSSGATPVRGRAVFFAVANGAGEVVSIDVTECDGGRASWAQAATIALGSLKGKKLRVPSTTTRAEMRIEVTSAWKLPSGQDPGANVSVLGLPVAKGEGKESTKVEILNPLPKVVMVPLSKDVSIPVVVWSLGIGTDGDPANIAAKARRVVHARLLDSKVL